jgi:hypothetical protein
MDRLKAFRGMIDEWLQDAPVAFWIDLFRKYCEYSIWEGAESALDDVFGQEATEIHLREVRKLHDDLRSMSRLLKRLCNPATPPEGDALMVYSTAQSVSDEILVRASEYVQRIEERTGDHFTTRERLRAALDDEDGHIVAEALSEYRVGPQRARRICDVDSGGLLRRETEQRLEAIAEALPAFFLCKDHPSDIRALFWLAETLRHCEHLLGQLLLEILGRQSKLSVDTSIDRQFFRKTLRSILAALKEFSSLPSFKRLMFHATGNDDFGTVPSHEVRLGNTDESDVGSALEQIAELKIQELGDAQNSELAVDFLAKLHAIARVSQSA